MAIQDDRREREMCQLIGLRRGEGRSEVDAFLDFEVSGKIFSAPIELKSTTSNTVSTARDVGPAHIAKWRTRIWVFGFYNASGRKLQKLLTLGPNDMEDWIRKIENYIAPDLAIGTRIADKLNLEDLYIVCGEKPKYSLSDAQALQKRQWNRDKYFSEMDDDEGYTPSKMLEILKLRALYLNQRGSTLNNPRIPRSFFLRFSDRIIDVTNTSADEILDATQKEIREITLANNVLQQTL
jgi:hypothetical protein